MNANTDVSEWIRLAEMDLATAHHMNKTFHPIPLEIVCFHSQQAAEKMLKCFLVSQQIEPPKTHDMQVLLEMCIEIKNGTQHVYLTSDTVTGVPFWVAMGFNDSGKIDPDNKMTIYIKSV